MLNFFGSVCLSSKGNGILAENASNILSDAFFSWRDHECLRNKKKERERTMANDGMKRPPARRFHCVIRAILAAGARMPKREWSVSLSVSAIAIDSEDKQMTSDCAGDTDNDTDSESNVF